MRNGQEFKTVAVLGSNSFSGAHFIQYLLENTDAQILAISRSLEAISVMNPYLYQKDVRPKRVKFHQLDINKNLDEMIQLIDQHKSELVVNYAAQGEVRNSWRWPHEWYETNCLGVVRLTEALRQRTYLRRYVSISTPEVYGSRKEKVREEHFYHPSTPYAASKLAGDLHLLTLLKKYDFPVIFTRAANVYGVHQQLYRIIPRAMIFMKMKKKLLLHAGGKTQRAFIHIKDVSRATYGAAVLGRIGEVYHLAPSDEPVSISAVVQSICSLMQKRFEDVVELSNEAFGQDSVYNLSIEKAYQQLQWQPEIPFQKGLEDILSWIQDNWHEISQLSHEYIHSHN